MTLRLLVSDVKRKFSCEFKQKRNCSSVDIFSPSKLRSRASWPPTHLKKKLKSHFQTVFPWLKKKSRFTVHPTESCFWQGCQEMMSFSEDRESPVCTFDFPFKLSVSGCLYLLHHVAWMVQHFQPYFWTAASPWYLFMPYDHLSLRKILKYFSVRMVLLALIIML